MNLLFITGNFESGKDGVGDYTFMMASECTKAGNNCAIIALNDVYLELPAKEEQVKNIPVLRFKQGTSWKARRELSEPFIAKFNPGFVSVQMVGYAYQSRGWIFGLGHQIRSLFKKSVKFEVNLHEVWLGFSTNHDLKAKINGFIQRFALLSFIKVLNPEIIHVGNNVYYSLLLKEGLSVRYLPLPSNIHMKEPDFSWIMSKLRMEETERKNIVSGIFFGSIQGNWDIHTFFEKLLSVTNKKLLIISVGKQGFGDKIWEEMTSKFANKITFKYFGLRTNEEISDLLQFADFGIGTTPLSLLGKSGTAMAMIEHGLPVIVTRDELKYHFPIQKVENQYPNVIMWDKITSLGSITKNETMPDRTKEISYKFLSTMVESSNKAS